MAKDNITSNATRANVWNFDPNDLVVIGVDTDDGPEHNLYDPRVKLRLQESMVLSIMAQGVLENVTVANIDGQPVVVDGRRRVLHAREALRRMQADDDAAVLRIPASFRKDTDAGLFATMVIANSHRLNDDPVAEGRKAEIMASRHGASDSEIAKAFGWTTQTLRNRRKLMTLSDKILRQVRAGRLSVTAALQLADLKPEDATAAADEIIEASGGNTHGQAAGARRASKDDDAEPVVGKRFLRKILATAAAENLSEDVRRALAFVCGDAKAVSVRGLSACIKEANATRDIGNKLKVPTNRKTKAA